MIDAPIRCGVEVTSVERKPGGGFIAQTSQGVIEADNVIAATGPFQKPLIPTVVPAAAALFRTAEFPAEWWPVILLCFFPSFIAIETDKALRKLFGRRR